MANNIYIYTVDDLNAPSNSGAAIDYRALAACFTSDTKIMCARGEVRVQDLHCGDRVITRHNGPQPIRWVGSHKAKGHGTLAPVCFKAGALGNSTDILGSPMHRMLISGPRAEVLFGEPELLACATATVFSAPPVQRSSIFTSCLTRTKSSAPMAAGAKASPRTLTRLTPLSNKPATRFYTCFQSWEPIGKTPRQRLRPLTPRSL